MPQIRGSDGEECRGPSWFVADKGIEIAMANGDHENSPSAKILHKKTTRVKFDRTRIVASELTYRDETSDNAG